MKNGKTEQQIRDSRATFMTCAIAFALLVGWMWFSRQQILTNF